MKNFNKQQGRVCLQSSWRSQCGQVSRAILVIAGAILLIIIIAFLAIKIASSKKAQTAPASVQEIEPPKPVYETTIGDIKFILQSSMDLGNVLKPEKHQVYQKDLTTTERFIKVVIGAQNKGKIQTDQYVWEIGNIIDSEGRNFIPITNKAYYFLPQPSLCGAILKPEFAPISCTMMYEVSKQSTGLKIEVQAKSPKVAKALLDLK